MPQRAHKYCQKEDCAFDRQGQGQPARKDTGQQFCAWCDDDLLIAALQVPAKEMHIKQALAMFKQRGSWEHRLALEKLASHELTSSSYWCNDPACVYSTSQPGTKARCRSASDFCSWCDPEYLLIAKNTVEGRKRLNQALSAFKVNPRVYDAARAMLGDDFVRSSNVCSNAACVFSYKRPGQRSCSRQVSGGQRVSDLCFWCDASDVADAETKPFGIRRIAQDLEVFKSAIGSFRQTLLPICVFVRSKLKTLLWSKRSA